MTEEQFYRFIMRMERELYGEEDEWWDIQKAGRWDSL